MALTTNNNFIKTLIGESNDAFSNLYEIKFEGGVDGIFDGDMSNKLKVRADGFTPPPTEGSTYQVKYVTAYIDRPSAKVSTTRNFQLKFRVDSNWEIYDALRKQEKVTFNAPHSFSGSNLENMIKNSFNVTVNAFMAGTKSETEEESNIDRLYRFEHCSISSISQDAFSNGDSSPLTVTCTINFLEMYDRQTGFPSDTTTTNTSGGKNTLSRPSSRISRNAMA